MIYFEGVVFLYDRINKIFLIRRFNFFIIIFCIAQSQVFGADSAALITIGGKSFGIITKDELINAGPFVLNGNNQTYHLLSFSMEIKSADNLIFHSESTSDSLSSVMKQQLVNADNFSWIVFKNFYHSFPNDSGKIKIPGIIKFLLINTPGKYCPCDTSYLGSIINTPPEDIHVTAQKELVQYLKDIPPGYRKILRYDVFPPFSYRRYIFLSKVHKINNQEITTLSEEFNVELYGDTGFFTACDYLICKYDLSVKEEPIIFWILTPDGRFESDYNNISNPTKTELDEWLGEFK